MRFVRSALVVCILLLANPSWSRQASQPASTAQPTSDPQAVAVVQAAIAALGGATAIGQAQAWDFEGLTDGPLDSGNKIETISHQVPSASIVVNGISMSARRFASSSLFLPVLAGPILLHESTDSNYEMRLDEASTLASKPVRVVRFRATDSHATAQIWLFDAATDLPARVFFESPAQIGQAKSFRALVDLSDYRIVSGALYPFSITTFIEGMLPETLNLQSLTTSITISTAQIIPTTGGAQ